MPDISTLWVLQDKDFGLGNFINLTPTLKLMADHFDKRIPVFFDLDFVRDCFLDCEFIEILAERPSSQPFFTSAMINYKNDCPDYIHVYRTIASSLSLSGELPHTYVDTAKEIKFLRYHILFIRGSGTEHPYYVSNKTPDDSYYKERFKTEYCVFTGSQADLDRCNGLFNGMDMVIGNIRESLALIRDADMVIANDSGLAHAAAAMNKNMVILWKNTKLPKNASPGKNTRIKFCH